MVTRTFYHVHDQKEGPDVNLKEFKKNHVPGDSFYLETEMPINDPIPHKCPDCGGEIRQQLGLLHVKTGFYDTPKTRTGEGGLLEKPKHIAYERFKKQK